MQDTDIIRTAFDRSERDMGCEFMDWEGWYWPNHFGDALAEHLAVRNDVGVWDASPLRKWRFQGRDALAAADRSFTHDMLSLKAGQVRYAPFCNEHGKMLGDGTAFKVDEELCIVVTALDADFDHFTALNGDLDVEIVAVTELMPQIGVNGPRARDALQSVCSADLGSLRYFHHWVDPVQIGGVPCSVSRTGYSGELGFEIFCAPDDAPKLWAAVVGAGVRPYGLAAVETLRIESGLIFIGYDYFPGETSPFDMSLDKFVRLDGPDFCGRDALVREAAGPPNRLVSLVVDSVEVPAYGAAVTTDDGQVGTLTSPCQSPSLGGVIGMAVIQTGLARVGQQVEVEVAGGTAAARIATLPAYDPDKTRPRA